MEYDEKEVYRGLPEHCNENATPHSYPWTQGTNLDQYMKRMWYWTMSKKSERQHTNN